MSNVTKKIPGKMEISKANGSEGNVSVSASNILLEPVEYIGPVLRTPKEVFKSIKKINHAENTENGKISHLCIRFWRRLLKSKKSKNCS